MFSSANPAYRRLSRLVHSFFAVALIGAALGTAGKAYAQNLTIDRIVSLPRLAGTAPGSPAWSPDNSRLAFVWNDQGQPFRDVWVFSTRDQRVTRLTNMRTPAPAPPASAEQNPAERTFRTLIADANDRARLGINQVVWSPDSGSLLFALEGVLYQAALDGSAPQPLKDAPRGVSSMAFSPDGRFLSLVAEGRLWLRNRQTGETKRADGGAAGEPRNPDVSIRSQKWSPDSRRIVVQRIDRSQSRTLRFPDYLPEETTVQEQRRDYTADKNIVEEIGIHTLASGTTTWLDLEGKKELDTSNLSWSPDGAQLLIDRNGPDAPSRWILVARAQDGAVREIWRDTRDNRSYTTPWSSEWRSDGKAILFLSDLDGWTHLYSVPIDGGAPRQLTSGQWEIVQSSGYAQVVLAVSPAREVFFVSTKKSPYERQVYRVPETGGEVVAVTTLAGIHNPLLSPDGTQVASLHSSDTSPPELYVTPARGGAAHRVTRSPHADFDRYSWIAPQYITFTSHVDGVTLHGRMLVPPGLEPGKRYPALLGPVYFDTARNHWQGTYAAVQQYLALEGKYIILQVDSRGSSGYGAAFRHAFHLKCGLIDIDDLESGVRHLKTLPFVDPDRIGIWGSSYGGLQTAQALFKKPGLFKAGVAGAPATNVWHAGVSEYRLFEDPRKHPESYVQGSAFSFGEDLRDHLMIIHGMQDTTVLFRDSAALAEKLMLLGKTFDLVVAPSASHGWTQKDYVARYLLNKMVDHFDRYVGRGGR